MKLLLDQNLSFRLVPKLNSIFPDSKHIKDFGLIGNDDGRIWKLAADQGFAILTKDSDFFNRSLLRGHPPKVIQLHIGNCSTTHILNLVMKEQKAIKGFLEDAAESLLVVE